jgi:hypothetical protein
MNSLYRKEKIVLFLKDYYFGYNKWITILRLIGGPLLITLGLDLYIKGFDKSSIAYSGFCILYGVYMIFKPYLWILFRLDSFKTEKVEISIDDNFFTIKDHKNESKIGFDSFINIYDKKDHFVFVISKSQRLRIPKRLIEVDEQEIIRNKIKNALQK